MGRGPKVESAHLPPCVSDTGSLGSSLFVSASTPVLDTSLDGLSLVRRGKVRDVYAVDDALVMIATDRISAFDYVLGSGIPDKGRVLTQLSAFWFDRTAPPGPEPL